VFKPGKCNRASGPPPAADALALLGRILPKLEDVTRQAMLFLDACVHRHEVAPANDRFLTGIPDARLRSSGWPSASAAMRTANGPSVAMREIGDDHDCPSFW